MMFFIKLFAMSLFIVILFGVGGQIVSGMRGRSRRNASGDDAGSLAADLTKRRRHVLAAIDDRQFKPDPIAIAQRELERLADLRGASVSPEMPLPGIGEARRSPIVFGQHLRPKDGDWLSYYGGTPTVPADFVWPMSANDPQRPIHFLLQWDCRQLALVDATGLLPQDGILYAFQDYAPGSPYDVRLVYCPGPISGWSPMAPPAALGPFSGLQYSPGCTTKTEVGRHHLPKVMPRWTFAPIAIAYPQPEPSRDDPEAVEGEALFWEESDRVAEELLKAQLAFAGPTHPAERGANKRGERPFPRFPHDWAAVRVIAANALERLSSRLSTDRILRDLDEAAKAQTIADWTQQAEELFAFAASNASTDPVPQQVSDDIWAWCQTVEPATGLMFDDTITDSVNLSLGLGSAALAAIPDAWIDRIATRHALAHEYVHEEYPPRAGPTARAEWEDRQARGELRQVRSIAASVPNRMFGPPSYVQGAVDESVRDHLLLLEMSSSSEIGFELGEGVIQCMIRPADLKERRFDKVIVIATAY